jgi:hypothetical protein
MTAATRYSLASFFAINAIIMMVIDYPWPGLFNFAIGVILAVCHGYDDQVFEKIIYKKCHKI